MREGGPGGAKDANTGTDTEWGWKGEKLPLGSTKKRVSGGRWKKNKRGKRLAFADSLKVRSSLGTIENKVPENTGANGYRCS